jgi:hypothetical protein
VFNQDIQYAFVHMLALAVRDIVVAASLEAHLTARVPSDTDPTVQ